MKGSNAVLASVMAAVALSSSCSSSSYDITFNPSSNEGYSSSTGKNKKAVGSSTMPSDLKEKFAPKFDGLKFIETLVTAHR